MRKTILITGSTDGIGLEAARMLVSEGHDVLLHGRNRWKLQEAEKVLSALPGGGRVESYLADLSRMADVEALAEAVAGKHASLVQNQGDAYRGFSLLVGDRDQLSYVSNRSDRPFSVAGEKSP